MSSSETIAVLGAGGTMGQAMAANLARAGFSVRAWNRSTEKAAPLRDDGAEVLDTVAEAVSGATLVLTMLTDADAVLEAMADAKGGFGEDPLWLQMSTIGEAGTERCAGLAEERGLTFVDAPVSGTKGPAQEGKLVVLASGPDAARERAEAVFDVVGQRTVWAGEAGAGTRLKLAVNGWLLAVIEGAAETLVFAEGIGLDPSLVLDAVSGGPLDAPFLQMKGKAMLAGEFDPQFALKHAAKDGDLMVESARQRGLDLPVLSRIAQRLDEAVEAHGDEDVAATYLTSAPARS